MANFVARIADAAARFPDRPAIEGLAGDAVDELTYAGLMAAAGRFAGWLGRTGFARGERAAILADNDGRWIAAYLGILQTGGVVVPLDTAYSAAQVATIAGDSGAVVLFTAPKYLATCRAAAASMGAAAPRLALLAGDAPDAPEVTAAATIDEAAPSSPIDPRGDEDAAVILYTSGTTADPKGVVLTHGNLEAERAAALSIVRVTENDAVLGVLPLFHALAQMANLLLPLTAGARVVFLETVSSTSLLGALQTRPISIFACVPQFFYLIHQRVSSEVARGGPLARGLFRALVAGNAAWRDLTGLNPGRRLFARVHRVLGPRMRVLVTGGSRFDPAIGRDLYGLGVTLLNAYGLTETSGGATIVRPGDRFTSSVGPPFPGVEVRIGPPEAAEDGAGEVLIRGPIVMREYYRRPDATAEALRDGWLHTGDLGRLDERGRLHITGRKKEVIVLASGKNLYPEEIEAHYRQAALVRELCVVGRSLPGQPAAERLHAVVVPDEQVMRGRGAVNVRERMRFELETLSVQLPAHKRILSYDISLEPLPRTTTGKIRRHEVERRLRERAAAPAPGDAARQLTNAEQAWLGDERRAGALRHIAARLERPAVPPDANLELDLGLDSMERVELLTWLEQGQGRQVAPDVRATIFTARQLVDAVLAAPAAGGAPAAATDQGWDAILAQPPSEDLVRNLSRSKLGRALTIWVLLRVAALLARVVMGYRTSGRQHLPATGPCLICPNHQAYLDGVFVVAALPFRLFRRLFFVGAAEYFQSRPGAWLARAINVVPVDPDSNLVSAMRAGAAGLRQGKVLILFPEGERSIDGAPKPFRKGAAILASHLDAPMVPVALDGLYRLWPRGRNFNWRLLLTFGARVRVAFGPPLRATRGEYGAGTTALQHAVEGLFAEIQRR